MLQSWMRIVKEEWNVGWSKRGFFVCIIRFRGFVIASLMPCLLGRN